ncbi:MAG: ribonuclease H-like domain-containing protein [Chitinophagales bacterium]|nr:ribonuclease H-like domain-containing protein [Chitinophagales bacterium]
MYLDAEWFPNQQVFLIGYARDDAEPRQLYGRMLTWKRFRNTLNQTNGFVFFYGPDIALMENHFETDIRNNYRCVNLLRVTRAYMPNAQSWRLAHLEKVFHLKRTVNKYKKNIRQIYSDWNDARYRARVLAYNRDDVSNLVLLKQKMFARYKIPQAYLNSIILQ